MVRKTLDTIKISKDLDPQFDLQEVGAVEENDNYFKVGNTETNSLFQLINSKSNTVLYQNVDGNEINSHEDDSHTNNLNKESIIEDNKNNEDKFFESEKLTDQDPNHVVNSDKTFEDKNINDQEDPKFLEAYQQTINAVKIKMESISRDKSLLNFLNDSNKQNEEYDIYVRSISKQLEKQVGLVNPLSFENPEIFSESFLSQVSSLNTRTTQLLGLIYQMFPVDKRSDIPKLILLQKNLGLIIEEANSFLNQLSQGDNKHFYERRKGMVESIRRIAYENFQKISSVIKQNTS